MKTVLSKVKTRVPRVYCVCYINKFWKTLKIDLKRSKFNFLEPVIPTVKVIRKNRSGEEHIEEIPMMFSYGFIKMPLNLAYDRQFLNQVRRTIPGIQSWLKSATPLHTKRLMKRIDNAEDFDDFSQVAMISKEDIGKLMEVSKKNPLFSKEDIYNLKVGDTITLRSYPFTGVMAEILELNLSKKRVTVNMYPDTNFSIKTSLPFDNILYSVYYDYQDPIEDDFSPVTPQYVLDNLVEEPSDPEL